MVKTAVNPNDEIKGLIGWFAQNHVAANLMMVVVICLGLYAIMTVKKESFPPFEFDRITVSVPYPGAGPEEVEEGIVVKIEEALNSVEGIRKITSRSQEGMGRVDVDVEESYELSDITDEVKLAVDSISTFPGEAERPIISKLNRTKGALMVSISGDLNEVAMKSLAEDVRDEIIALPEVTYAEVNGGRAFEISIEVDELTLREYGLTLAQVANSIRSWSVDIPGGSIRTQGGDIRLRAKGQAYREDEFARIVLLTNPDGTIVTLGDIATVKDGFVEFEFLSLFNGRPSISVNVLSTENESELKISEAVKKYVAERNQSLPGGVKLAIWGDTTFILQGQLEILIENMVLGAILVFLILGLFLQIRFALWVLLGLPFAFLGAFMCLPLVGITINMMSLFAFILVLGIVVDDAIIIAESAYAETEVHGYSTASIVRGAQRIALPATFGVLTTVMAFAPNLFSTGPTAGAVHSMSWVVVFCLLFSLIESKLILPSHLSLMRSRGERGVTTRWADQKLKAFVQNRYKPFLNKAIEYRYATIAFFIGLLILTGGLFSSGMVRFVFFPDMDMPFLNANVQMLEGVPEDMAIGVVNEMQSTIWEINEEIKRETGREGDIVTNVFAFVRDGSFGQLVVELDKTGAYDDINPKDVEDRWRKRVGVVAGTKELSFKSKRHMGGDSPIEFRVMGKNYEMVEQASEDLANHLKSYDGLYEIETSSNAGPEEIKLRIKPGAESLGITLTDLARQVREAFYGAEAQRFQRDNQEIRVMVRYPREQRRSVGNLENMWIRLPDGRELPFSAVAEYDMGKGYSFIKRIDGKRAVSVTASANLALTEPGRVLREVQRNYIDNLMSRYPGVSVELDGSSFEERESLAERSELFFITLIGIYILLAIPLRSYLQPLIIMSVIPFGIIGAVIGHMFLGVTINAFSIIGFFALAGVVVNDSLIMVDYVNRKVVEGMAPSEASVEAGGERFRAILLTSLTTFFGLIPILSDQSPQAQMVIPTAVSLAFGIAFATVITLVFVPCLYNILGDFVGYKASDEEVARSATSV
jgi:multidrug efflux pump subunit AcrB